MININAVERHDLVLLAWMWLVDDPIYVHQHPDHYFMSRILGNWDGCRTHQIRRGKEHRGMHCMPPIL